MAPVLRTFVVGLMAIGCSDKHPPARVPDHPPPDGVGVAMVEAGAPAPPPIIDAAPAPTGLAIDALKPNTGDADGGTYVVLKGNGFLKDGPRQVKVYFGARQGSIIRFASDSELIVQAPGGKADETVDVLVIFEPGGTLKLPAAFTFIVKSEGSSVDDLTVPPKGITILGAGRSTEGTLTADGVMARIRVAYVPAIQRCYKDFLKKAGSGQGKASLTFTVTKRGKTSGITVTSFAPDLDKCLSTAMAIWTFPVSVSKDGSPQDVSFNVALNLVPD